MNPKPFFCIEPFHCAGRHDALLSKRPPNLAGPLFIAKVKPRLEEPSAEIGEPIIALRPMTAGSEVVEDYGHVGLTLRHHPVTFLRDDLTARRIVTCTQAMDARGGRWLEAAGLALVRQRPGSAKACCLSPCRTRRGWPTWWSGRRSFRRVVMGASMIAVGGRIQREGEVVHSSRIGLLIFKPSWRPSAPSMRLSRCRMDAATTPHTRGGGPIHR